jgi:hypothetical protein
MGRPIMLDTPVTDEQHDYLQTIDESAGNLLAIVNDARPRTRHPDARPDALRSARLSNAPTLLGPMACARGWLSTKSIPRPRRSAATKGGCGRSCSTWRATPSSSRTAAR